MTDQNSNTTVEAQHIKSHGDGHEVYESPEVENQPDELVTQIVGTRIATDAIGGEAIPNLSFEFGDSGMVEADLEKTTKNYAVYESESAIDTLYVSRETLGLSQDEEAPESIGVTVAPSDESAFDEALSEWESRAEELRESEDESDESLLSDAGEDAVEVEEAESDEAEETLLDEAEEAAS
jgi:hypothetical protein